MSQPFILIPCDISKIRNEAIKGGLLQVMPSSFYKQFTDNEIKFFMHQEGLYVLPTSELLEWLKNNIKGITIEIGAGHGALSRALKVPITDSRMQENPAIMLAYLAGGQPPIKYASDIEKLNAKEAIKKYRPNTVFGCFITHIFNGVNGNAYGVDEINLLQCVNKYIHVGNLDTHRNSALLTLQHTEHYFDWLITRSLNQKQNRIFIWEK